MNLQSVTEESRLDEFLSTAQLAGTEFTAGQCASLSLSHSLALSLSELRIDYCKTSVLYMCIISHRSSQCCIQFTHFFSEKLNIKFVDPGSYTGLPSAEERLEMEQTQKEHRQFLNIPRRSEINNYS